MIRGDLTVQSGYMCRATSTDTTRGVVLVDVKFHARSEIEAIRWIRDSLRVVATELEGDRARQASSWLTHGFREAMQDLQNGRTCVVTVEVNNLLIVWDAHPAILLLVS